MAIRIAGECIDWMEMADWIAVMRSPDLSLERSLKSTEPFIGTKP